MSKLRYIISIGVLCIVAAAGLFFVRSNKVDLSKFSDMNTCHTASSKEISALVRSESEGKVLERAGTCLLSEDKYEEARAVLEATRDKYEEEGKDTDKNRVAATLSRIANVLEGEDEPVDSVDDLPPARVTQPGEISDSQQ